MASINMISKRKNEYTVRCTRVDCDLCRVQGGMTFAERERYILRLLAEHYGMSLAVAAPRLNVAEIQTGHRMLADLDRDLEHALLLNHNYRRAA